MEKNELRKYIKNNSRLLILEGLDSTYSKDSFEILLNNKVTGKLTLQFLKGSHVPYGAIDAVFITCSICSGKIWEILNSLNLSFRKTGQYQDYLFFLASSQLINKAYFKNHGIISFYSTDNIQQKVNELFGNINVHFSRRIYEILLYKEQTIEDILLNPSFYGYPMTTILIICYLNQKVHLIDDFIVKGKANKLYDSNNKKVIEVREKLDKYFSSNKI